MKNLQTFLRFCLAAFCISVVANAQNQRTNPAGKFYVANTAGDIQISNGVNVNQLAEKSVYTAEGTVIETKANSSASIVLSNGTGIYLDGTTRVQVRGFNQEAFRPNRSDMQEEPSVSHTQLYVEYGAMGISTSKLAAGSTMEVDTPDASASIHGGQAMIRVGDGSTQISMVRGNATVRTGPSGDPHPIVGGQQLQVQTGGSIQSNTVMIQNIPAGGAGGVQQMPATDTNNAEAATRLVYFNVQTPIAGGTPGAGGASSSGAIQVYDSNSTQGATTTQGATAAVVAIPVVPVDPTVQTNVSPANLTSTVTDINLVMVQPDGADGTVEASPAVPGLLGKTFHFDGNTIVHPIRTYRSYGADFTDAKIDMFRNTASEDAEFSFHSDKLVSK